MAVESSKPAQQNALARLLYTQNPFYLISCGFILYGLQVAAAAMGDQFIRASFLTSSLGIYTALMAITAIAVIRLGKIWDDARTILLVIVIGQIAYSITVDELCTGNARQAALFLLAGAAASVVLTEIVLRVCQIRFPFWYRAPYFAVGAVFYAAPLVAGHFRADDSPWSNWSALFFSMAVGGALLLLIPAVRRGKTLAENNGTPWNWPLFPMSLFFILAVLAGLRSHAIWMSFGSLRGSVSFEMLLLMPLLLAAMVLLVEWALAREKREGAEVLLWLSPGLLICGTSSFARWPKAFDVGLSEYGGSTMTVALMMLIAFYVYSLVRGVVTARSLIAIAFFAIAVLGREPVVLRDLGFEKWMMAVVGCAVYFGICQLRQATEMTWLTFMAMTGATIIMAGGKYGHGDAAVGIAGVWCVAMMLLVGWLFDTEFGQFLRSAAAILIVSGSIGLVAWHFLRSSNEAIAPLVLLGLSTFAMCYMFLLKRVAWGYLSALTLAGAVVLVAVTSGDSWTFGLLSRDFWQLKTGAVCFVVGVAITSAKTGIYRRKWHGVKQRNLLRQFQPGF